MISSRESSVLQTRYNVMLKVQGKGGCYDSVIKSKYIDVQAIPVAGFHIDQKIFCGKKKVMFQDSTKEYTYYLFDYGDNSSLETSRETSLFNALLSSCSSLIAADYNRPNTSAGASKLPWHACCGRAVVLLLT